MRRLRNTVLAASVLGLSAISLPARAAVTYSFAGGAAGGSTTVSFAFAVTTPQFITTPTQLPPAPATCTVMSPILESCSIATDIFFVPGKDVFPASIAFSALLKPVNSDFALSQTFGAEFRFPPNVDVFSTPGLYTATSLSSLSAARLEVSGFADPMPSPIPEPSTWLLLMGGLGLTGAAIRQRKRHHPLCGPAPEGPATAGS